NAPRPLSALLLLLSTGLGTALSAQDAAPPRTLADLRQQLAEKFRAAQQQENPRKALENALAEQARELASFLQHEAKGEDVHNARLMLVETFLNLGEREKAVATLEAIDAGKAPALALAVSAQFAEVLGLDAKRKAWIDAALAKPAPFDERMALGMHLLTALR